MPKQCAHLALFISALLVVTSAHCGQSLQPGFYSHEPETVDIRLGNASSGLVCNTADDQPAVCNKAIKVVVTGEQTCTANDGKQHPCTRYGYQFDYSGARPGETIDCKSKRQDAFRTQEMEYSLDLASADGKIFHPSWVAYAPVNRRTMLSVVHECSYRGELLASIEFIIYYEPGTPVPVPVTAKAGSSPGAGEPYFEEVPDACRHPYLTEETARRLMQSNRARQGQANEHIPNIWSQCTYTSIDPARRSVGYVFKFMLHEMFDVDKLSPVQLNFNATFASGGQAPQQTLDDLGKKSFVFNDRDRTTLMVITGIQGPPDGANRPRQFIANYYLKDADRSHEQRLDLLRAEAEMHLRQWAAGN